MKKTILFTGILIACLCSAAATVSAKDGKEKKDVSEYLPEAGDFAVSVSANPFINFVGNIFNNTVNQTIGTFGGDPYNVGGINQPRVSIAGKYMLTDELGLRVNLGWIHDANTQNAYVPDDAELTNDPLSGKKLTDSYITRESGGSFSAAIEYRVGKRRVQGVFSAGLLYAFSYKSDKYSFGNAITEINQNPTISRELAIDSNPEVANTPDGFSSMRYLKKFNDTPSNYAGLILSAGIEWFVAPKISIGGEVNISAVWNWTKATYYTAEGFNTLSGAVEEWTELLIPSSHGFSFGTGNIGSNLSVTFYF